MDDTWISAQVSESGVAGGCGGAQPPADLAFVARVVSVDALPGRDEWVRVVVTTTESDQWTSVVRVSDGLAANDRVVVFFHDAILPAWSEFAFLAKRQYRVAVTKLLGERCDCLVTAFPPTKAEALEALPVGTDVTRLLEVTKYTKTVAVGEAGPFPSFLPHTDEVQFKRVRAEWNAYIGRTVSISLKYDGTSCTVFRYRGTFGVCSRNQLLPRVVDGFYWPVVAALELETRLPDNTAVQMEIYGPKINGNRHGCSSLTAAIFAVLDLVSATYYTVAETKAFTAAHALPMVQILEEVTLTTLEVAMSATELIPEDREGVVMRIIDDVREAFGKRRSCKVLNALYAH